MNKGRALATIMVILGVLCLIFGILSITFLQVSIAEVDATESNTSDYFYLRGKISYYITIVGSKSPWGYGSGNLEIISTTRIYSETTLITYSFDGTADLSIITIGSITVPISGQYQLIFTPLETYLSGGSVKIAIQESLIHSLIGIDDIQLIILAFPLIIGGLILRFAIGKNISTSEVHYTHDINNEDKQTWDNDIDLDFNHKELIFKKVKCPTCGIPSDSLYCHNCGTQVREY
ncbi:MAG: zinc ribbon domain-containing protein [Candidatus Heimdallarchaeota archaeon]|nr:zinc ribbon domain-containing protein [Candidatus Heimdallarchaeota archaeon]